MPLAGTQLSYKWALALGYHVGFRGRALTEAVAVMCAESARYTEAYHDNINGDTGEVASTDRGLFQINSVHDGQISAADAFKAIPNAEYAFRLSKGGTDFSPWAAYNSGAHEKFLLPTRLVKALHTWKLRVAKVPVVLG